MTAPDSSAETICRPLTGAATPGTTERRPLLLDLFCCEGGAATGYHRAGFDVVGVDIDAKALGRYPFESVCGDALTVGAALLAERRFAAVHASPPCHDHGALAGRTGKDGTGWLLAATRELLVSTGLPYVIENVPGAVMPGSLVLCGTEFGLTHEGRWLRRHRQFESNVQLWGAGGCNCRGRRIGGVYGQGTNSANQRGWKFDNDGVRAVMGMPWATRHGCSQAIPPAYTEFIGEQLLAHVSEDVA